MLLFILILVFPAICYGYPPNEPPSPSCQGLNVNKSVTKEAELLECLFNKYRSSVRPVTHHSQTVQVNVSFYVVAVAQVYDKENAVTLDTYIGLNWKDHRLVWDPSAYDGIKKIFVNYWRIWEPELTVWDNRDSTGTIVEGKKAHVTHKGEVEWISQVRMSTYCWMDHSKFPFDEQICRFQFQHHVYDTSLINMNVIYPANSKMSHDCYSIHNEWEVTECIVQVEKTSWKDLNMSYISLEIYMQREYSYHYYLIVIPSVLVVLFTLSLLWLPHESNQRFAAVGAMLFVILLTNFVLQQFLPAGIGEVPVIASYLLYSVILLMIILIISLVTYNLHSADPRFDVMPDIIKKIFFNVVIEKATCVTPFFSMPNLSVENKAWSEPIQRGGESLSPGSGGGDHRTNALGQSTEKLLDGIRKNLGLLTNPPKTPANEWKQLALTIDRLAFYIFFLINIIVSTALYAH